MDTTKYVVKKLLNSRAFRYFWIRAVTAVAALVVFCVVYTLILPASASTGQDLNLGTEVVAEETAENEASEETADGNADQRSISFITESLAENVPENSVNSTETVQTQDPVEAAGDKPETVEDQEISKESEQGSGTDASGGSSETSGGEQTSQAGEPTQAPEAEGTADAADVSETEDKSTPDATAEPKEESTEISSDESVSPADESVDESADSSEKEAEESAQYSASLDYESDELYAEVNITDIEAVPDTARLSVVKLTKESESFDAYLAALNRGLEHEIYNSGNALFYDITVMVGEEVYEPVDGNIDVVLRFKDHQLSEELGLDTESGAELQVFHLPVTEEGQEKGDGLTEADIECEHVADLALEPAGSEEISFSLNSLSVITVTGATTDVTVNASLLGTDMKSLGYNLYAYLLASNDQKAYGAKIEFENKQATAVIKNVPPNSYKLYLVYARDNRELQPEWNYGNVLDANVNNWVDTDGGYIFGYAARMPEDKTVTPEDNTVGFALEVTDVQDSTSVTTIMDRALNYGIVADDIKYNVRAYTNFATKHINISNSNDSTIYSHRADGIDVVPNILADIDHNGQPMSTQDKDANYYVQDKDKGKVSSQNQEETIIRNKNEIEDRVEIMISNVVRQSEALAGKNMLTLPKLTQVDVSPYGENATIIVNATALSGEQNGFTIVKRPGQTVVFNFNGQNVAPPQNTKIKLVDVNGNQIGNTYVAGDAMRDAPAADGNVWNKVIWNFPDATSVTATNQVGGIFLVPKGDFTAANKGGGWIVARGKVSVTNEWYGFPGSDEPFKQKIIRKTFVGIPKEEIDPEYLVKLWTSVNDSASGTTHEELITQLVMKPADDPSLIKDPTGQNDQTGYISFVTDEDNNVVVEWRTPPLSVGNEHKVTEENAASTGTPSISPDEVEFVGPYSRWDAARQDYVWESRETLYNSASELAGVFNVSSHNEDYRQYAYITNRYRVVKEPHNLTLTKKVVDPEKLEAENQEYQFEIILKDEEGTAFAEGTSVRYKINGGDEKTIATDANGSLSVKLKKNDKIDILELPYGTQYAITENNVPSKCTVEFGGDSAGTEEATGRLLRDHSVTATNTYADDPGVPIAAHKDLVDGILASGQFKFRLVDSDGTLVQEVTNDAHGNIAFDPLIFAKDGEYDYKLYEVEDPAMEDIIFDPAEYTVHVVAEGGRAREVTYKSESGSATTTIPMFRNKMINEEEDVLTAHKMFIDDDTGKAVKLNGGEFAFKAVSTDEDQKIEYTGTNDADGMVTFKDKEGNVVDLNTLDEPADLKIFEVESYSGAPLEDDKEITYDTAEHNAKVTVETHTVTTNPWTESVIDANNTRLSVEFTPSDPSGDLYYVTLLNSNVLVAELSSDNTLKFDVTIHKSHLSSLDNVPCNLTFEYGKGNYHNTKERLGIIVASVQGGNWNDINNPVKVNLVKQDGSTLEPTQRIEKTVHLSYEEGQYPTFVNHLHSVQPETMSFLFSKVWRDATGTTAISWPEGTSITVSILQGKGETDNNPATFANYTIDQTDASEAGNHIAAADASKPDLIVTASAESGYSFKLEGLPATDGGEEPIQYVYYVKETEAVEGYQSPKYYEGSAQKMGAEYIGDEGTIANDQVEIVLPSTGGRGTKLFTILGLAMMLGAGVMLFRRRSLI